ncbi:MAG: FAD-dependent oxidoreductase [Deltaproteobacteria bacterium]|nr:FAD-dependent oxidoreductase [Deltaproteobacteria bacterium]
MKRSLKQCTNTRYDLVVIGGGIHGAAIACHAAEAGFSTLLLEKQDFSGATSANSLKILHGGLRYLQHLNIRRMRQSICSRREMMRMAPHLVKPLACLMPAYGYGIRGKEIMRLALLLNDAIGWDRNKGVDGDISLAGGRILDRENCIAAVPGIEGENLRGGVVWHDALSLNTERMVLEYLLAAADAGCEAANYAEVTQLEMGADFRSEVIVHDRLSDERCCIRTSCIVNAAGPWLDNVIKGEGIKQQTTAHYAMALNIVVNRPLFRDYAVALEGSVAYDDREALIRRGKRLYFFVPWRDSTMIGTNYRICDQPPDSFSVSREDIHTMVDEVNRIYSSARLNYGDVTFYHAGLLPISGHGKGDDGNIQLEKHSRIIDHDQNGFPGLLSVRSVKYTTAPALAREVIECLEKKITPSISPRSVLAAGEKMTGEGEVQESSCREYLQEKYGRRAAVVSGYLQNSGGCEAWISLDPPLLKAEVEYCMEEEMALTLADIVLRRTDLGTEKCPPDHVLNELASLMAKKLGWDSRRKQREIDLLVSRYSLLEYYDGEEA